MNTCWAPHLDNFYEPWALHSATSIFSQSALYSMASREKACGVVTFQSGTMFAKQMLAQLRTGIRAAKSQFYALLGAARSPFSFLGLTCPRSPS